MNINEKAMEKNTRISLENLLNKIEEVRAVNPNMRMVKYATPELITEMYNLGHDAHGWGIEDVIKSGLENDDAGTGVYAGGPDTYKKFAKYFDLIIKDYHNTPLDKEMKDDWSLEGLDLSDLDPTGDYIVSTRARFARNPFEYPFPSAMSKEQRLAWEQKAKEVLTSSEMPQELQGEYYPLVGMSAEQQQQLIDDHFLFNDIRNDSHLVSAGFADAWPEGRGIFISNDRTFMVWIGEEDNFRVISLQQGGNLASVFTKLSHANDYLNSKLEFCFDEKLGVNTTCPTNLGTGARMSVMIKLPNLSGGENVAKFKETCKALGVQPRGEHGEHSKQSTTWDISPLARHGVTPKDIYAKLQAAAKELIRLEKEASGK